MIQMTEKQNRNLADAEPQVLCKSKKNTDVLVPFNLLVQE